MFKEFSIFMDEGCYKFKNFEFLDVSMYSTVQMDTNTDTVNDQKENLTITHLVIMYF